MRGGSDTGFVEMFLLSMWGGVGEVLIQGLYRCFCCQCGVVWEEVLIQGL